MSASSTPSYPSSAIDTGVDTLVEIVVDGGPHLGFGHVGRCLALWEEFRGRAVFRMLDDTLAAFLQARGVPCASAQGATAGDAPILLLDRAQPTDAQEVRSLRTAGRRVVLLDDLGSGRMAADAVIDPPTAAAWPPAAGVRLAGFEHVLVRREVREAAGAPDHGRRGQRGRMPREDALVGNMARGATPQQKVPREGVLLAMGGSDPARLTVPLSEALVRAGIEAGVAFGPGYKGARPSGARPLERSAQPDRFVGALARAALLVCGYGHSLLEAAHLGVPAISAVFRKEHLPHAHAFCRAGTACMLDMSEGPRPAELVALVGELLGQERRRAEMARRGRELVDGLGAARTAAALRALA
jgi:spore coat polysaccharide biosynthesis predicted glycosyltransferase SpsG